MGTTDQGYSVYAQVIYGGRISLVVALVATVIAMTIAIVLGLLAAYKGGWVDDIVNLVANIFIVIPGLPLLIVISSFLPATGPMVMALIIGLTSWAIETRVLRGQALTICNRDFILAARASGESTAGSCSASSCRTCSAGSPPASRSSSSTRSSSRRRSSSSGSPT